MILNFSRRKGLVVVYTYRIISRCDCYTDRGQNQTPSVLHISPSLMPLVSVQGFLSAVCVISPAGLALLVRQVLPRQPLDQVRSEQARGNNSAHLLPGTYGGFEEVILQTGRCEETLFFSFSPFTKWRTSHSWEACEGVGGWMASSAGLQLLSGRGVSPALTLLCLAAEGGGNKGWKYSPQVYFRPLSLDRKRNFNTAC